MTPIFVISGKSTDPSTPGDVHGSTSDESRQIKEEAAQAYMDISGEEFPPAMMNAITELSPFLANAILKKNTASFKKALFDRELKEFFENCVITTGTIKSRAYSFPPGHPKPGRLYRPHPLSGLSGAEKSGFFIPDEGFDQLLLEEREAELIRLLVELGATRILISEKNQNKSSSKTSVAAHAEALPAGKIEARSQAESGSESLDLETREFKLSGRPWNSGMRLERQNFAWLAFEPSWGALVTAREIGQCTSAAVEIKENTSFSSEKHAALEAKTTVYGAGGKSSGESSHQSGKSYYIAAEFAPFGDFAN